MKSGGVSRQGDALEWAALSGQTIEKKSEELSCELPVQMARCVDRDRCMLCHFSFSDERRDVTAWEGTPQRPQMAAECEASQLQLERLLRESSDDLYC